MKLNSLWQGLACCVAGISLSAATRTWDGSASGFWTNAVNWTANVAPINGDALVFPAGPTRLVTTNTPGGATNFTSLTFSGDNYRISGPPLALTNGLTNATSVGAVSTIVPTVLARGTQTWSVATKTSLVLASNLNFASATLTLACAGIMEVQGSIVGGAGANLTKLGGGRLELPSGNHTLNQLRVGDGTLLVNGSLGANSTVISNGAVLTGTGTISVFTNAGELRIGDAAGQGTGRLTVTAPGTSVFLPGSRLQIHLHDPVPSLGYDQLRLANPPDLTHGSLLLLREAGSAPVVGEKFVIITNLGSSPLTTTFTNLPQGSLITNLLPPVTVFQISYQGGNGNDVELAVVDVRPVASGVTRVYDAGAFPDNGWSRASNWVGDLAPASGDTLVFPSAVSNAQARLVTNTLTPGSVVNQLCFGGQPNVWSVSGNKFLLLGGIVATNDLAGGLVFGVTDEVRLVAPQSLAVTNMELTWNSPMDFGSNTLTVATGTNGLVLLRGRQFGSGRLLARGGGICTLDSRLTNELQGGVALESGTLQVFPGQFAGGAWQVSGGELNWRGAILPGLSATAGNIQINTAEPGALSGDLELQPGVGLLIELQAGSGGGKSGSGKAGGTTLAPALTASQAVRLNGATLELSGLRPEFLGRTFVLIDNQGVAPVQGVFAGFGEGQLVSVVEAQSGAGALARVSYVGGDGNDVTVTLLAPPPTGTVRFWSGLGADANWSTAANWEGGLSPSSGDVAVFPAGPAARTNVADSLVFLDRLVWEDAGFVQQGGVGLLSGLESRQATGTNLFLNTSSFLSATQFWSVSNVEAVVSVRARPSPPNSFGSLQGAGALRKIGAGTLELNRQLVDLEGGLTGEEGTMRLLQTRTGPLSLSGGILECREAQAGEFRGTDGELVLNGGLVNGVAPDTGLTAQGLHLHSNLLVRAIWASQPGFNPLRAGQVFLDNPVLSVSFPNTTLVGDRFQLIVHESAALTGTFAGLTNGASADFGGFLFRIEYEVEVEPGISCVQLEVLASPAPRLTQSVRQATGEVLLRGQYLPNSPVVIEATQDFLVWTVLGTVQTQADGTFVFVDGGAVTLSQRFYRPSLP